MLLVAKSAFAAAPHEEMQRLAEMAAALPGVDRTAWAFTEQGTPSLREALLTLRSPDIAEVLVVPLVLPMEPSFHNWLRKSLGRWRSETGEPWPRLRLARGFSTSALMPALLADLIDGPSDEPLAMPGGKIAEGSVVPPQKRRVLVCEGGACNAAGADSIWGHLRNLQERRKLRVTGNGTMTAKSTCLGPCNLAPVLQVFPEGTYYGGVTENAIERIVEEHLLGGLVVDDFAYHPTGRKQKLRPARPDLPSFGE